VGRGEEVGGVGGGGGGGGGGGAKCCISTKEFCYASH